MAIQTLTNLKTWLDGYDVSGDLNEATVDDGADMKDASVFGLDTHRMQPGLKTAKLGLKGFWQADDSASPQLIDKTLFTRVAVANSVVSLSPAGGAEGDVGFSLRALLGQYAPGAKVGDLFAFTVSAEASGGSGLVRGTVMHNAARTATGTGTIRQLGAVSATQKVYAALHVLAVAGTTPTLVVKVQSAALVGFGSPTDEITFASANAIGSQWATPLAGAITDAFWRLSWTITGSAGQSFTFVVVVGIQ